MSLRKIINWEGAKAQGEIVGTIASPFYQLYDDQNNFTWACDVDIGQEEVLQAVPIATNNRDILYADIGKPVSLARAGNGKYQIVGLAKTVRSTAHIMYLSAGESLGAVFSEETIGYTVRRLTYEELDTCGGYGVVPYGACGRFDAAGSLVKLIY